MNNLINTQSNQGSYAFHGPSEKERLELDLKLRSTPKLPVYRGCMSSICYCSGQCKEIIGYRDRLPGELTPGIL
jgi:hypothetical protein